MVLNNKIIVLLMAVVTMALAGAVAAKTMPQNNNEAKINIQEISKPEIQNEQKDIIPETTPKPTDKNNIGQQCIVTLFEKTYDVTYLIKTHSGGNIFICGSDMTEKYKGKHGTDLKRMEKYQASGAVNTMTNNPVSPKERDNAEDDD